MIVPVMAISNLVLTQQIYSEETNGAHAHNRDRVLLNTSRDISKLERLRFTFTPDGKREFVPRDQVFPLMSVYCLLLLLKNK